MRTKPPGTGKQTYGDFSMIFNSIIKNGIWAQWSPKAKAVYIAILTHAYNRDNGKRTAIVSVKTIAKESGISTDNIALATKEIAMSGWMAITKGGRNIKFMNIYELFAEQRLTAICRQVSLPNTYRKNTVKCIGERSQNTGRFIPIPEKDRVGTYRKNTVNDTSRCKTVKNKTINTKQDVECAGAALACQGQALPASMSTMVVTSIGKIIELDQLKYMLNHSLKVREETLSAIRSGQIKLMDGISLDEVVAQIK